MSIVHIFSWMETHSRLVFAAVVAVTLLLLLPVVFLAPDTEASTDPEHEVFDTQALVDERLVSPIFETFWIVEARDGDLLRRDSLLELLAVEEAMRDDPEVSEKLLSFESAQYRATVFGVYTIADGADRWLRDNGYGGLEGASDDEVKLAVSELLADVDGTDELGDNFSNLSTVEEREVDGKSIDYWTVPAMGMRILADNEALGGGGFTRGLGGDERTIAKEEYSRDLRDRLMSSDETIEVWGVAIDTNLTSEEEGATAGPFIALTIIAVLIVVGVVLRSYWAVAVTGAALAVLMVWLKGISNLIGLENSLIMSFIVPIAMISFGIDFAFHAVGRYREAAEEGAETKRKAFVLGLTAVSGALLLALVSDSLAFLSNITAGIPAVVEFGIGATIALVSAFIVLGIMTPLALVRVEERAHFGRPDTTARSVGRWALIAFTAVVAGLTVLLLIFFPALGAAALLVYTAAFVVLPLWLVVRRRGGAVEEVAPATAAGGSWPFMGKVVICVVGLRHVVIPLVLAVTALAAWNATKVQAAFDVKDFFSSESPFVVGLDKLDEHIASGEPAILYIEGDLSNPDALAAVDGFIDGLDASSTGRIGRLANGEIQVDRGALLIVQEAMASPAAVAAIAAETGVELSDADGNLIPDTSEGVLAVYEYAKASGVPGEAGLRLTPAEVPSRIWISEDGDEMATQLIIGLTGTRELANVARAREELRPMADRLERQIEAATGSGYVSLTGSPIARDQGLTATVDALLTSLPIAVVLCFLVAWLFMRSLRYAIASTIPILLVVAWLYGFMALLDFNLNLATATIGAISIGVGIDYAIHFTMRFREELARHGTRTAALELAGSGTGSALMASAASSVIGFAIMAFAPMPLFATYGLLTAVMILFAASASLLVLPSLLMVVSRDQDTEDEAEMVRSSPALAID